VFGFDRQLLVKPSYFLILYVERKISSNPAHVSMQPLAAITCTLVLLFLPIRLTSKHAYRLTNYPTVPELTHLLNTVHVLRLRRQFATGTWTVVVNRCRLSKA